MKRKIGLMFIFIFVLMLTGCATIMTGTSKSINFSSNVPGAKVYINDVYKGVTPMILDLETKNSINVRIEAPGYHPFSTVLKREVSGWVWGNILTGGVIGFGIDIFSGGMYVINENSVTGNLEKVSVGTLEKVEEIKN